MNEFDDVVYDDGPEDPQGVDGLLSAVKRDQLAAKFRKGYDKAKFWKDADELVQTLPAAERTKLF